MEIINLKMKNHSILFFSVILYLCSGCSSIKEIPSFVHLCKRNDPEFSKCFNNTLYEMIPYMVKGVPEMDIAPIDPLQFSTVKIDSGGGTAVSLLIDLSDGILSGLKNMDIKELRGNIDTVRFSVTMQLPYIRLEANYKMKGKILLFELDSVGRADLNATDLILDIEWYGSLFTKKGKQHIRFDRIEYKKLELQNLVLSLEDENVEKRPFIETVIKSINENIDTVKEELDVLIKGALGEISLDYFNRVYRLFPNEQLFPKD